MNTIRRPTKSTTRNYSTLRRGEALVLDGPAKLTILTPENGNVRLLIEAPPSTRYEKATAAPPSESGELPPS